MLQPLHNNPYRLFSTHKTDRATERAEAKEPAWTDSVVLGEPGRPASRMPKILGAAVLVSLGLSACQLASQALPPGPVQVVSQATQWAGDDSLDCMAVTRYDKSQPQDIKPFQEYDCLPRSVLAEFEGNGISKPRAIWAFGVPGGSPQPRNMEDASRHFRPND